jgi:hypothetical protein
MPAARLEDEIARLYQLPLSDFTAARNMLAKRAGARAAEIKSLAKPPLPAWAVNQVFWQDRATYDRLLEAAADVRAAHAAVLAGKRTDVRASGRAHEEAIEAALKSALAIVREAGHPATDATRQAIATTLRALPGDEPPGRLSHTLQPGGFEVLAGLPVKSAPERGAGAARGKAAGPNAPAPEPQKKPAKSREAPADTRDRERERERERTKEARATAEREVRLAEHTARREEFEAARAAREADKATRAVTEARRAVEDAEAALAEAEQAARAAREAKEAADARTGEADAALQAARDRLRALPRAVGRGLVD